ncbi:MAG: YIP1 family protein [Candidatus Sumerlaeia bacterium]|nr:YIP1 family protein [Candidatus Sumerlaeia bacterium]
MSDTRANDGNEPGVGEPSQAEEKPLRWVPQQSVPEQRLSGRPTAEAEEEEPADRLLFGEGRLSVAPFPTLVPAMPSWERIEEVGFFRALCRSVGEILFHPGETFSRLPRRAALGWPLLFLLIVGTAATAAATGYEVLRGAYSVAADSPYVRMLQRMGIEEASADFLRLLPVLQIALTPFFLILNAFASAGIFHVSLLLFGGARHGYETTFRTLCYVSGAVHVLAFLPVPYINLAMLAWFFAGSIAGLSRSHQTPPIRVAAAVLMPAFLLACCLLAALLMVMNPPVGLGEGWTQ